MRGSFVDTSRMTLKELVELRRSEYSKFRPAKCPLLDEKVSFNNKGFFHLTHNGRSKLRGDADQRMRLNLVPDIHEVITKAHVFGAPDRFISANDGENKLGKDIHYYELFHRFSTRKAVSVVIRRIGNGPLHYYSVRYATKVKTPKKTA